MYKLFLLLLFLYFLTFCASNDVYDCNFVAKHLDYMNLTACKFTSYNNSNNISISCILYGNSTDITVVFPVSAVLEFTSDLYLLNPNKSNKVHFNDSKEAEDWYCLGISSTKFAKILQQPVNAKNVYKLPSRAAGLLSTIIEANGYIEFNNPVVAGFVQFDPTCDLNKMPRNDSCITSVRGTKFALAPLESDPNLEPIIRKMVTAEEEAIDHKVDFISNVSFYQAVLRKLVEKFFQLLGGQFRTLTLSSSLEGPFAANWIRYLKEVHIQTLNLSNNNFNDISWKDFRKMNNLTRLILSNCKISSSKSVNFFKVPNLKDLDLSENFFTSPPIAISTKDMNVLNLGVKKNTPPDQFNLGVSLSNMKNLTHLTLGGLPLINISPSSFPVNLIYLDISNCKLSNISEDIFSKLPNLKEINLSRNYLATIAHNTFSTLNLDLTIILSYNNILTSRKNKLNLNLNSIDKLDLSYNKLNIPNYLISNGTVKLLDLSGNYIINWTTVNNVFNNDLYNIINLNLSFNEIPSIDNNMISSLNTLDTVDIGGNPFDCQDCSLLTFQHWLNKTHKTQILLNGKNNKSIIECLLPLKQKNEPLLLAQYNVTSCVIYPPNLMLIAVLPSCIVISIIFITTLSVYIYRFEITYIRHLLLVKRRNAAAAKCSTRDGYTYDVFVSFCRYDRDWVKQDLIKFLNVNNKYTVCLHERDFKLGTYIVDNIINCIEKSRHVILVLTKNFINSQWCKLELQLTQGRVFFEGQTELLILIELERLERDSIPPRLRMLMDSRTYLEWPGAISSDKQRATFWSRLKEALGTPIEVVNEPEDSDDGLMNETEYLEQPLVLGQPLRI